MGTVTDVLHTGQDLLAVTPAPGTSRQAEVLVPFVAAIAVEVDLAGGRLVIDPPPGLLDLGQAGSMAMAMRRAEAVKIDVITIFPEYFSPLRVSLLGKAAERGLIEFAVHDLRTWAHDVHKSVDDTPFGGGPGMVMSPVPWGEALDAVLGPQSPGTRLVVPTPAGVPFRQETAATYSRMAHLVFACGRYEGIDARFAEDARTRVPVDEVSVGDYVLSGGEPAVLVMIDAICRLLPGVLGNAASAPDDSFGGGTGPMAGLLEGPVFTRPRVWREREVPAVLLSGRPCRHRPVAARRGPAPHRGPAARSHGGAARGYAGWPRPGGAP